jgi:hypothetical protein
VIVLLLAELCDQLVEVACGVREKLVEPVFLALRVVASHESQRRAEAPAHGLEATGRDTGRGGCTVLAG